MDYRVTAEQLAGLDTKPLQTAVNYICRLLLGPPARSFEGEAARLAWPAVKALEALNVIEVQRKARGSFVVLVPAHQIVMKPQEKRMVEM